MQNRHEHRTEMATMERIKLASKRVGRLAYLEARAALKKVDWKPLVKKAFMVTSLLFGVYLFSVWARGTNHALFVPYTPYDTQRNVHREIALAADAFFTRHPTEMCISSLELSVASNKDQPFFHIILRSNMHHSYDGHFYDLLNAEYVSTTGGRGGAQKPSDEHLSRLHAPHQTYHNRRASDRSTKSNKPSSEKDAARGYHTHNYPSAPAPSSPLSLFTFQSSSSDSVAGSSSSSHPLLHPHRRHEITVPADEDQTEPSFVARFLSKLTTTSDTTALHAPIVTASPPVSEVASAPASFAADGVLWTSGLHPTQDIRVSSDWSLRREEKTYCEYVYYMRGSMPMQFIRWLWPGFALHPQKLPMQTIYRKKKIHIRYLDLGTTKPFERTFEAEHAYCIQHYLDVFNKQWEC